MTAPWFLTMHAIKRCREMSLDRTAVVAVLDDAEITWPSYGRVVAAKGELAVVHDPTTRVVVTVLWWTQDDYQRAA